MIKSLLVFSLFFLIRSPSLQAFWLGNPGEPLDDDYSSVKFVYDDGTKDVEGPGNREVELAFHRFYLQYTEGTAHSFGVFIRGIPQTSRLNFEGSGFNPALWGLGVGARWSPPEPLGPFYLGLQIAGDWIQGEQDEGGVDSDVTWLEGTAAGGISFPIDEPLSVYAGVSLIRSDITLEVAGSESDIEQDDAYGGYFGLAFVPNEPWTLGLEIHLINEQTVGAMLNYSF
ncbi:MAG: outer membrane beta-barrel protein [Elusimicrobia bacterium]|nr:outer membrane beta-barrel protein [Elusimicrobiota bacterium]